MTPKRSVIVLRLEEFHHRIQLLPKLDAFVLNVLQCFMTIDLWLSEAQQVQIGTVDYEDGFLASSHCGRCAMAVLMLADGRCLHEEA